MTELATGVRLSLELDCEYESCTKLAKPLLEQLVLGDYELCSVLEIPPTIDLWLEQHRTARKRANRSCRRGYVAGVLEREKYADEIYAINTSADRRQGRAMTHSYRTRPTFSPLPRFACERHAIRTTGIWAPEDVSGYSATGETTLARGALVGYIAVYRCGDLALVSQILGHADHLENEIMFQLFAAALRRETGRGPGFVVYNRHDSGTDGLRFFKERLGFDEAAVEWLP